ncbi:MAG: hypothetical protein AB8H80_01540 [Planctomycetota bacterium]
MRLCPSVESSAAPLITHRIGADVCLARQDNNFHKCHRCVYRGKAKDWESDHPDHAVLDVFAADGQDKDGQDKDGEGKKAVEIPRPKPATVPAHG